MVVMNDEIHAAKDVKKMITTPVQTFQSPQEGMIGTVIFGDVLFFHKPSGKHTLTSEFSTSGVTALPRVDIVYAYGGADGVLIDAIRQHGTDGLVLVGFGGGSYPTTFLDAGKRAVQAGIPVVLATRSTAGRVIMTPQKATDGFMVSDDLMPQKARILLMLGLSLTRHRQTLQELFYQY